MKKLFTLIIALIACNIMLKAQTTGGPDAYGYTWRNSNDTLIPGAPVYNWIDIVGLPGATQVKNLADDNTAGPFPIGFNFRYYWYNRTTFRIGSNGYIIFNNGAMAAPFSAIPSPLLPQDYIGVMTSDITFVTNASTPVPNADCWFYTTPNSDSLIVSWINVPFWDGTLGGPGYAGENTFQMILTSVDSSITMQYMTQTGVSFSFPPGIMTIGIENVSGTVGLQHSHDVYPPTNYAIKYYYPPTSSFVVNDASTSYNDNEGSGGLFISNNGAPYIMNTEIENTGNTILNSFNVTSQILNSASIVVKTNTVLSDTLQPSQTQFISHTSAPFNPTVAGNYTFVTNTQLVGDLEPLNNSKTVELRVLDTTQASMTLQYENATASTGTLSWTGGNGGAGYYLVPPFYPCKIDTVKAFIVSNINAVNFYMEIIDDDGPFKNPGTRLDSQMVFNPQPVNAGGDWFSIALPTPIQINSGGFYLSWNMDGDGINLGTDFTTPMSNRTFEVLGSSWAIFRFRETQDLMIRATISKLSGVGITEPVNAAALFGDFYPNPSSQEVSAAFTMPDRVQSVTYAVYDMQGKEVAADEVSLHGKIQGVVNISTTHFKPGVYNCRFIVDGKMLNRRFVVIR